MYAVIETGGKQYRVELGSEIEIDRLEAAPGETIELGRVLLLADGADAQIGRPIVDGATVSASVVRQDRGDKVIVFKYRPKARRRVKHGHRQDLTIVRVSDIVFNGRSAAKEAEAGARRAQAEREAAEQEAARKAAADKALAEKLEREQKAADKAAEPKSTAKSGRSKPKAGDEASRASTETKPAGGGRGRAKATAKAADEPAAGADERAASDEVGASEEKPAQAKRPRSKKEE